MSKCKHCGLYAPSLTHKERADAHTRLWLCLHADRPILRVKAKTLITALVAADRGICMDCAGTAAWRVVPEDES